MVTNVGFTPAAPGFARSRPQDLNGDGRIDLNEYSQAQKQHFLQKTGGTGQLKLSEVQAKLNRGVQAGKLSALEAQAILAKLSQKDLNKDGIIDANEFESSLKQKFALRDKNGDGGIDANEQALARQERGPKPLAGAPAPAPTPTPEPQLGGGLQVKA